jgi:mannosyl-glycoprotein endo-beta-N-acetylglucosaminidase
MQWPPEYPHLTAQYFTHLDPSILAQSSSWKHRPSLSLRDIYTGVDLWGRGSHGGGGFGSYKAIAHIDPEFLGLSVALFGPAWTWESEEDKPGWSWDNWWDHERRLWVGSESDDENTALAVSAAVSPGTRDSDKPQCPHGPFVPLVKFFFERHPPPKPELLPLHVSFCPGVGRAWFVDGIRVFPIGESANSTWTDIDKQTSLGDLVWPHPELTWWGTEECGLPLPRASATIDMRDAWNGGSSLRMSLSCDPSTPSPSPEDGDPDVASFHCVWVPIQSVSLTPGRQYEAHLMYKKLDETADVGLSLRPMSSSAKVDVAPMEVSHTDYPGGWHKISIQFISPTPHYQHEGEIIAAAGLIVGFVIEDPSEPWDASIILGQLNVFSSMPPPLHEPRILWATLDLSTPRSASTSSPWCDRLSGFLKWEVSASFPGIPPIRMRGPEDPIPVWTPDPHEPWFPKFLYFNIYAYVYDTQTGNDVQAESAVFIGTTGLFDGRANRFWVSPACLQGLPRHEDDARVRFYVQGVTDRGIVLPWHQCAYVDVAL